MKKDPLFYKPIASSVQDEIDEATKGDLQPQMKGEEYADTVLEGLAPFALAPLTGGASLTSTALRHGAKHTPKILKKILEKAARPGSQTYAITGSNVAGTLGSSAALKAYTDAHDDPSLIGAIAASQLGQGVGRGLRHLAHPKDAAALGLGTLTHFEPRRYAAQKDLELPLSISTTSKNPVVQRVDKLLSKTPGSKSVMTAWAQKREKALAHGLGLPQEVDLERAVDQIPKDWAKKGAQGYDRRISKLFQKDQDKVKDLEKKLIQNRERFSVDDLLVDLSSKRYRLLSEQARLDFDRSPDGQLLQSLAAYKHHTSGMGYEDLDQLKKSPL